ncbi:hypothetical protein [Candidatus Albibeggiatoa sp. nov. BB20]|uniref:hypothetical protein n=1 Tax=Candidatus Albibeggiatoa sp. nov. BB20 TaxID=3162723 RepID=UPI003365A247
MHSVQLETHIDKQGLLKLQLPNEWANQDVNVILVLEKKTTPVAPPKQDLSSAFELLTTMPDDFMQDGREDTLPQEREALL